jgi:hypothetical protein
MKLLWKNFFLKIQNGNNMKDGIFEENTRFDYTNTTTK